MYKTYIAMYVTCTFRQNYMGAINVDPVNVVRFKVCHVIQLDYKQTKVNTYRIHQIVCETIIFMFLGILSIRIRYVTLILLPNRMTY